MKNHDLRLKQELLNPSQHKLTASVATRWGATYDMVSRTCIVEQQQAINAVLAEDRKNWYRMLSDSTFSVLETVVAVLKPLSILTDALPGGKSDNSCHSPHLEAHSESFGCN